MDPYSLYKPYNFYGPPPHNTHNRHDSHHDLSDQQQQQQHHHQPSNSQHYRPSNSQHQQHQNLHPSHSQQHQHQQHHRPSNSHQQHHRQPSPSNSHQQHHRQPSPSNYSTIYSHHNLIDPHQVRRLHSASPYARRVSLPSCLEEMPRQMPREGYGRRDVSPAGHLRRRNAHNRKYNMRPNFAAGGIGRWERWEG